MSIYGCVSKHACNCTTRHIKRQAKLREQLQYHVQIAQQASRIHGSMSKESMVAWDIVEETSRALHDTNVAIAEMQRDPLVYRDDWCYDVELSVREYDV